MEFAGFYILYSDLGCQCRCCYWEQGDLVSEIGLNFNWQNNFGLYWVVVYSCCSLRVLVRD